MKRILIIDDILDNLITLEAILSELLPDSEILTASSGPDGLVVAERELPDVILLDIQMPRMDGYEVCDILKSKETTAHIPVVFLTAFRTDPQSRIRGLEAGAVAFLTKPVSPEELVVYLQVALRSKAEEDQLRQQKEQLETTVGEKTTQLLKSERLLEKTFASLRDALLIIDVSSNEILDCNPAASEIFGYSQQELIGKTTLFLYEDEPSFETFKRHLNSVIGAQGFLSQFEFKMKHKNGTVFPTEHNVTLIEDEFQSCRWVSVIRNLTKQKQTEVDQRRLSVAVHQIAESIVITDEHGIIQYVNPAFEKITGYHSADVLGKTPRILKSGKQEASFYEKMWDKLLDGEIWSGFIINRKKDGTLYEENMTISPIRDHLGKLINYVAVKYDVTHEKELEKQLRESQKMEAIGILAGGIAHDFNNILSVISGYTELICSEFSKGSREREILSRVLNAGDRAKDLVQQILTFSRHSEEQLNPVNIIPIVKESIKFLRASLPSSIEIQQEIDLDCPNILADHTQFHQIIMNLCTNAGYAMRQKGGILKIGISPIEVLQNSPYLQSLKPGNYLEFIIADTGTGIPPEIQSRIFEPFFTSKPLGEGTGLGLSVVYGIIQRYGGAITFESKVGQGTTFKFYIPTIPEKVSPQEETPFPVYGNESILIVDDETVLTELFHSMLTQHGYTVSCVNSSQEALALFKANVEGFDLVITDQTMPGMTGDLLAQEILSIRPVPIILMTGFSHIIDKERAEAIGIKGYLPKPVHINELGKMIRDILDSNQ
ncbi:response regulator [Deltaproteobacteria bacterium TL4]